MRIALRLAVAAITSSAFSISWAAAQQADALDHRVLDLVVMITGELADAPAAGAGIVFGGADGRLFIATANHVVPRGPYEATGLRVRLRPQRASPVEARLTPHFDADLDLAVLAVDGADRHGLSICDFPTDRLGHPDSLARGDEVYPVGYPNGIEWGMPVVADRLADVPGDLLTFQSVFLAQGHSGGALLTGSGTLVGLIREDQPPFGRALHLGKVIEVLRGWGYPVGLHERGALHRAAATGDVEHVRDLLTLGCADLAARDANYDMPLHVALRTNRLEVVRALLEHGAAVDQIARGPVLPLHLAALYSDLDAVRLLLEHGADVDGQVSERLSETPLHMAARRGDTQIAKLLLAAGADVNASDRYGLRPLHIAAHRGHPQVARVLLAAGADVHAPGVSDQTALHRAVEGRQLENTRLLLAAGADVNARAWDNLTPLYLAVEDGELEIIKLLLAASADVNTPGTKGRTPLHLAVEGGQAAITRLLLAAGADVNARDHSLSRTPLHYAGLYASDAQLAKLLLDAGADMTARDADEWTPLHLAVRAGKLEITRQMLEAGADVNARDRRNRTPLSMAGGNEKMIRLLLARGAVR